MGDDEMKKTAVSNTGPILHLQEIKLLKLDRLFSRVIISELVSQELAHLLGKLPQGIEVYSGKGNINQVGHLSRKYNLHPADVEVLSLCKELKPDLALADDLDLRDALREIGIITTGTVGLLFRFYTESIISSKELEKSIDLLFDYSSLYLSKAFRKYIKDYLRLLLK